MQQTICAKVDPRLLSKASRLFTDNMEGRIIEILQNARRAGATEVRISNREGLVTVQDNGSGIENFQKLLDLGGSGWDEKLETGEDPAGVGLFSLAPRDVEIVSGNRKTLIDKDGWTGKPVEVKEDIEPVKGTILKFRDEKPWDMDTIEKHAVFAGIRVIVDSKYCHQIPFCSDKAVKYNSPGCKIEVADEISEFHRDWSTSYCTGRVLVNFHGQVVELDYWPGQTNGGRTILVDLADKTDIRLMLPARTRLVENAAFEKLKNAIELEYYKYFQRQDTHCLKYDEYLRAKELGIELAEAAPQYRMGLIWNEYLEPVDVTMPKGHKLRDCYLCFAKDHKSEKAGANAHLLAALGRFNGKRFVPVTIDSGFMGYSWSKLPKVTKVTVTKSGEKLRRSICCAEIACFDKLSIKVETSDGRSFESDVAMAVDSNIQKGKYSFETDVVCVTSKARKWIATEQIWLHMGGFNDSCEADSYDGQFYWFEKELNEFWAELVGPYENLRQEILSVLRSCCGIYGKWQRIIVTDDETLEVVFKDGKTETIKRPKAG